MDVKARLIIIDAHDHIHECFNLTNFLDSAYENCKAEFCCLGNGKVIFNRCGSTPSHASASENDTQAMGPHLGSQHGNEGRSERVCVTFVGKLHAYQESAQNKS